MTQTCAIFMEAYRNLNSKKLFWVVLVISVLVVAGFAAVGINEDGITIAIWSLGEFLPVNSNVITPAEFYKMLFVYLGIGFWLSFIATILALISTAGIFVDLVTSGSIDLVVSKPIGRLRLFITQYVAALLFVTLQVTLFTTASFLLIGIRGGAWEPGLFLAVPMVVCFFSYLFSVSVLVGLKTRSTVASLLLTLLFWFGLFCLSATEQGLLKADTMDKRRATIDDMGNRRRDRISKPKDSRDDKSDNAEKSEDKDSGGWSRIHAVVYGIKTVLPKTDETIGLLERWLIDVANLQEMPGDIRTQKSKSIDKEVLNTIRSRSVYWIVGTSLGFELVILSLAAGLFCRRDY